MIEQLKEMINGKLPGQEAQLRMAPPARASLMEAPDGARLGAVMILLFQEHDEWFTLLIHRSEDGSVHSGQIGFPGGKAELSDTDLVETASRECEEEIGIPRSSIEILGSLTPLYIPPSNFFVTPVVGYINAGFELLVSEREVRDVFRIPLHMLLDNNNKETRKIETPLQHQFETPVYLIDPPYYIWGATAMMIAELEILLNKVMTLDEKEDGTPG